MGRIKKDAPGEIVVTLSAQEILAAQINIRIGRDGRVYTIPKKAIGNMVILAAYQIVLEKSKDMLYDIDKWDKTLIEFNGEEFNIKLKYKPKEQK